MYSNKKYRVASISQRQGNRIREEVMSEIELKIGLALAIFGFAICIWAVYWIRNAIKEMNNERKGDKNGS